MATMPPQPPGSQPPQAPATPPTSPPSGPPAGPPSTQYVPAQPGAPYAPTPAYAPQYAAPAPRIKRRTGWMIFAQVLMIIKAILWLLFGLLIIGGGVYLLINGTAALSSLPGYTQYFSGAVNAYVSAIVGVFIGVGVVFLVIGVIGLILGIVVGRPSNAARWIAIVLTVLAGLIWVVGLINGLSNGQSSLGWLFALVYLATDVIVFYALAINGNARRAFAGKP